MPGGFPLALDFCNNTNSLSGPSSKGTSVTGANKSYGAWTQLIASTTTDACFIKVVIWPTTNSSLRVFANIGVGAAASEKILIPDLYATSSTNGIEYTEYFFPCQIPAGTRVSAQFECSSAADPNNIVVHLYDASFAGTEGYAGVDSMGADLVNAKPTDVDPGAVVNTYGSYTQLTASTSRDYAGLMMAVGGNSTDNYSGSMPIYLTVAIGAAASEVDIIKDINIRTQSLDQRDSFPLYPIQVPSGTRIALKAAQGNATAGTRVIGVVGYGVYY